MRLVFVRQWIFVLFFLPVTVLAQERWPFEQEVNEVVANDSAINRKKMYLFTGSSSIRMWRDIKTYFPNYNVVNRGFGGSKMSDLHRNIDKLVLQYKPKMIFIYEGDNDLADGKSSEEILAYADSILHLIRTRVSKKVTVAFISPKPSLSRWTMKEKYLTFNQKLKEWTSTKKRVKFIDVWTPMLDANGNPQQDLFLDDGLHMKKKGYDIWAGEIRKYLK